MSGFDEAVAALGKIDGTLAAELRRSPSSPRVHIQTARDGSPTASLGLDRPISLHSAVNPQREAEKLVRAFDPYGAVFCLGLGLGYHLSELLRNQSVQLVVVVDFDRTVVRALLERWSDPALFTDPRIHLLIDPEPREVENRLTAVYLPVLHGALRIFSLRARVESEPERFSLAARAATVAATRAVADYRVHQLFARQWMRNIVINSTTPRRYPTRPQVSARTVITAAGPSLDSHLRQISDERENICIIATDTSLPALNAASIDPDVAVAVDAQMISYLHVAPVRPDRAVLVADLGVHHAVADRFPAVLWVGGGHPLIEYLRAQGVPVDRLETGDGSVTHSCLRLSSALGTATPTIVGADFGYPRAAGYARGTYIGTHSLQHASRIQPAFSTLYRFVLDSDVTARETEQGVVYTNAAFDSYRRSLEQMVTNRPPEPSGGFWNGAPTPDTQDAGRKTLAIYHRRIRGLPPAFAPEWIHWSGLDDKSRQLWTTLLPLAAYCFRQSSDDTPCLESARQTAIGLLDRILPTR